jgi:hypothetical protein
MTPSEALAKAQSGFGSNFIADQDPVELVKILEESMVHYSENTTVSEIVQKIATDDETDPLQEGVFTFTVPESFHQDLGLSDDDGLEQLYRIIGSKVIARKCEDAVFPLTFEYSITLDDWDPDTDLPASVMLNPLIRLLKAKIGVFNNQCLKDIGKFTQAAEESGTDWDSKVTAAEEAIESRVYIPSPKSF